MAPGAVVREGSSVVEGLIHGIFIFHDNPVERWPPAWRLTYRLWRA
jgi:hypothetical protein